MSKKPSKFLTEPNSLFMSQYENSSESASNNPPSFHTFTRSAQSRESNKNRSKESKVLESKEIKTLGNTDTLLERGSIKRLDNQQVKLLKLTILDSVNHLSFWRWQKCAYLLILLVILLKIILKAIYDNSMDNLAAYQTKIDMMASILRPSGFFLRGCTVRIIDLEYGINKSSFPNQQLFVRDHTLYFYFKMKEQANVLLESFQTQRSNLSSVLICKTI